MTTGKEYIATLFSCSSPIFSIDIFVTFRNNNLCKCRVLSHHIQKAANMSKIVAIN